MSIFPSTQKWLTTSQLSLQFLNQLEPMKIDVVTLPYYRDCCSPDVSMMLNEMASFIFKLSRESIWKRTISISLVEVFQNTLKTDMYVLALSGEDDNENQLACAVNDFLQDCQTATSPSSCWQKLYFAGFEAAKSQQHRSMYTQDLPQSLCFLTADMLAEDDLLSLECMFDSRVSNVVKTIERKIPDCRSLKWKEIREVMQEVLDQNVPVCEQLNLDAKFGNDFGYSMAVKDKLHYFKSHLKTEFVNVEDCNYQLPELTDDPEDFTWQEYFQAKRDYFANVIDWDVLIEVTQKLEIKDLCNYYDEVQFRSQFQGMISVDELQTCLDFIWRFKQIRHVANHAMKMPTVNDEQYLQNLTLISRKKRWSSQQWPNQGRNFDFEDKSCCLLAKMCDAENLCHQVVANFGVDQNHLSLLTEEFTEIYLENNSEMPEIYFKSISSLLSLIEDSNTMGIDDLDDLIEKLRQCHVSISCLFPDNETEQMCDKIYYQIRLYSLQNSYQIENRVRKCRKFIEKYRQIIDDSIGKLIFDEMTSKIAAFVGLWPPPLAYQNRVVAFFPQCAEDNLAPAIRQALLTTPLPGNSIDKVSVKCYTVKLTPCCSELIKDSQLCVRCRECFTRRLKNLLHKDLVKLFYKE